MERDFSHSSVMERGPSKASEGVYLSLKGRLVQLRHTSIWLLSPGCPGIGRDAGKSGIHFRERVRKRIHSSALSEL